MTCNDVTSIFHVGEWFQLQGPGRKTFGHRSTNIMHVWLNMQVYFCFTDIWWYHIETRMCTNYTKPAWLTLVHLYSWQRNTHCPPTFMTTTLRRMHRNGRRHALPHSCICPSLPFEYYSIFRRKYTFSQKKYWWWTCRIIFMKPVHCFGWMVAEQNNVRQVWRTKTTLSIINMWHCTHWDK